MEMKLMKLPICVTVIIRGGHKTFTSCRDSQEVG